MFIELWKINFLVYLSALSIFNDMFKILILLFSFLIFIPSSKLLAQKSKKNKKNEIIVPVFPGGDSMLVDYLNRNKKSKEIINKGYEGVIRVSYLIDTFGKAQNPKITTGLCKECDNNAIEMVNNMPLWSSAIKNGSKVSYVDSFELFYFTKWNKDYYYNRGLIYYNLNELLTAANCFKLALQFNPDDYDAAYNLAVIAKDLNDDALYCYCLNKAKGNNDLNIINLFEKNCNFKDSLKFKKIDDLIHSRTLNVDSVNSIVNNESIKILPDYLILNLLDLNFLKITSEYAKNIESNNGEIRIIFGCIVDVEGNFTNIYVGSENLEFQKILYSQISRSLNVFNGKISPIKNLDKTVPFGTTINLRLK